MKGCIFIVLFELWQTVDLVRELTDVSCIGHVGFTTVPFKLLSDQSWELLNSGYRD